VIPTTRRSPTRPRFAFTISCFPSAMVAHISRDSLPLGSDPRLLHLNDPSCGVNYLTKKSVIIKAPLKGCGTVRRNIGYRVFFHNKVVVPFGYGNKRSLSVFPFKIVTTMASAKLQRFYHPLERKTARKRKLRFCHP
ncbi:unnamed protein product, partial [Porites lobata]